MCGHVYQEIPKHLASGVSVTVISSTLREPGATSSSLARWPHRLLRCLPRGQDTPGGGVTSEKLPLFLRVQTPQGALHPDDPNHRRSLRDGRGLRWGRGRRGTAGAPLSSFQRCCSMLGRPQGKKQLSPYSSEPIFPIYSPSKQPDKTDVDLPQLSAHLELCTFQCASFPSHRGPWLQVATVVLVSYLLGNSIIKLGLTLWVILMTVGD